MNILIIEDEPLVAISLSTLVMEIEPQAFLEGPLPSVKLAAEWLSTNPAPDLILSDIQLSDGISLDIFLNGKIDCPIIFTTAYNEYAIRAFKVNSIDYLLKPVEKIELEKAFQKFHQLRLKFNNQAYIQQMMELFGNFAHSKRYKERFAVHLGRNVTLVDEAEIVGFVKEEIIYLINWEGRKFITDYRSLDEIQEIINPLHFFRANRQYIIQSGAVDGFRCDDGGKIIVRMKCVKLDDIYVSKEKAAEFRKWFDGQ